MTLNPKHIIFIAVSNYLSLERAFELKTELSSAKKLSAQIFIQIIEKHFDFKSFRDKPIIPEDIWLYNYLMYDNNKKGQLHLSEIGEKIHVCASFRKSPLIKKYESKIIVPQLKALRDANKILSNFE